METLKYAWWLSYIPLVIITALGFTFWDNGKCSAYRAQYWAPLSLVVLLYWVLSCVVKPMLYMNTYGG